MPTSVAALMARLEEGLARRRTSEAAPAAPAEPPKVFPEAPEAPPQPVPPAPQQALPPEPPQVFPEAPPPAEDRLQSAIASLQRLAANA